MHCCETRVNPIINVQYALPRRDEYFQSTFQSIAYPIQKNAMIHPWLLQSLHVI